ncbi:MAG: GTPase domain-containing protein [Planctomycetes bacterium]|nr:GTPase domain-containing protein [Planctomycetota bacterium]
MTGPGTTNAARGLLEGWRGLISPIELPPGLEAAARRLEEAAAALGSLCRRLAEGPEAPLRLAFFGPTGAGKSKLFNSLLGRNVSPAGFRRPFTLRPVYSLHEAHAALAGGIDGEVVVRGGEGWRDVLLIDTPDFDSVERANRAAAERVFREAEAFLFVTDAQKYADQSTWEYLERIFREGTPVLIVLNKVAGDGAPRDFRARLEARFGHAAPVVVREHAVDDATLLPASDRALSEIRDGIARLEGGPGERREALVRAFRGDLGRSLGAWEAAAAALGAYLAAAASLRERLAARYDKGAADLEAWLDAGLDPELKAEVYARVLERIQRIDILRYPRRLLALPFEGVKLLLGRWWPFGGRGGRAGRGAAAPDEAFERLEGRLLALAEETREDFRRAEAAPGLLSRGEEQGLRIPHEELREVYEASEREHREWLRRESETTASRLTGENKLKFILSQVIYNAVVVGVQVHTAGHFTLVELAADGVLSPIVAKAVGMAVSSERVGEFERAARAERHRRLRAVLTEARGRFERHLERRTAWRGAFEAAARGMEELGAGREAIARLFEGMARGAVHAVR